MNHTLKSLLITSVLTLPSVFGAAFAPGAEGDKASSADRSTSAVDLAVSTPVRDAEPLTTDTWKTIFDIKLLFAEGPLNEVDTNVLTYLGSDPNNPNNPKRLSFDSILDIAFKIKLWELIICPDEFKLAHALISSNPRFTDIEKSIFIALLPNPTPHNITRTITKTFNVPTTITTTFNVPRTITTTFYTTITDGDLTRRSSADILRHSTHGTSLGYYKLRIQDINYYELVNYYPHPAATRWNSLVAAADRLAQLRREDYHDRAASLYELAANLPTATTEDIRAAAAGLKLLELNERANALLEKYGLSK